MSSKRIGLYLVSFSGGGAERELIYLANEFSSKGYDVDLIVHRASGPLESLVEKSVNKIIIDKTYIHDVFELARYMRSSRPLFMLSTLHVPNWVLSLAKLLSFTKTKIFWRVVISLSNSKKNGRGIVSRLLSICYPLLSHTVSSITCVSKGVADDLITNFSIDKSKVNVMYNPAYTENIHQLANEPISHRWFNNNFKTIVSLGRLSKQKDFATLIHSFKTVHEYLDQTRLVIFGEGALHTELQDLISELDLTDVVELFGFEINPYKYLAKADLFVLSSIYEGFGNVIVEALALDVPVVSTNCPSGPSEILDNGEWGTLVAVGDNKALAKAVLNTLNSDEKMKTLIRAQSFSVHQVADGYIKMIQ